ncbi:RNA polymerase subunit sigma-70 [Bacillus thuringiensis]|nr:RNA polymerase subunit sigma-70 [Bacillus thuringiensis]PFE80967.1 RNA polymerase subunit sigma-70 [Bacillus thuringiensis]PFV38659.1 RNA polymerase subunit sigma-70 [Bacillus thuringiensis]PGX89558.1 RNA polymerase subunit sigma-70 [Bacillus thuringiensis]
MNDVWKVVLELPKKHREIIILDAKYELSYEEMAETLGVSIGTVKSRLSRARSKVSKLIGEGSSDEQ